MTTLTAVRPAVLDENFTDPALVLLTVEEAARRLRIGRTTCFRLVMSGEIESVTVGRLRRVPVDALCAYVAKLRRSAAVA
ncbi:excisionase family DNA-binding protein [Streptomyces sp. L2]|uniref:excisionase family DNA-binding protein n=1 Tax=Streptomyces sp. L2 TaxID=2162665 RepID=UPI0010115F3A|nr:excisionase family DNA-binding protein [Streptomyces sp. L2]